MTASLIQIKKEDIFIVEDVANKYSNFNLKFGWLSNTGKNYDYGHWNNIILDNSKMFPYDHNKIGIISQDPSMESIWKIITSTLGERSLCKVYVNGYTFGTDAYAHIDDVWLREREGKELKSETCILYLNKEWDIDWAGETVVFNDEREIEVSVLPKFGRIFIFDSSKLHAARPLSRICPVLRTVLVFKTMGKKAESKEVDFIWKITKDIKHTQRSFFQHLFNTMLFLEKGLKCEKDVVAAGLFHSVYGTEFYDFKDDSITRDKVKELIGDYAESIVYEFCNTTDRFNVFLENKNNYSEKMQKDLLMIELANLAEQNPYKNNAYSDKIKAIREKLNNGHGESVGINSKTSLSKS